MMCHSNATTEKFYEADLDFQEAFETQAHTADAICQSGSAEQDNYDSDTNQSESTEEEVPTEEEHVSETQEEEKEWRRAMEN